MIMTLYLELGGRTAILNAVSAALAGTDATQPGTAEDFTEFLVFLFGGAPVYEGPALHQTLGSVCRDHAGFDRLADALARALIRSPQTRPLDHDVRRTLEQIRCHAVRGPHPVALSAAPVAVQHPRFG